VNFKIDITEMYSRIPWKPVADPFESEKRIMGTTGLGVTSREQNARHNYNAKTAKQSFENVTDRKYENNNDQ